VHTTWTRASTVDARDGTTIADDTAGGAGRGVFVQLGSGFSTSGGSTDRNVANGSWIVDGGDGGIGNGAGLSSPRAR
jgi:hypothetical protein